METCKLTIHRVVKMDTLVYKSVSVLETIIMEHIISN